MEPTLKREEGLVVPIPTLPKKVAALSQPEPTARAVSAPFPPVMPEIFRPYRVPEPIPEALMLMPAAVPPVVMEVGVVMLMP